MSTFFTSAVTSAAESVNEAQVASSVELFSDVPKDASTKGSLPTTVKAIINGEEKEITVAFTDYSMELPKNMDAQLKGANPKLRFEVKFHFAEPEVFWQNSINLFDRNGKYIEPNTEKVLVSCPTADTYWRLFEDNVLNDVQVHTFSTIEEYAQTISNTMLLSRGLNNVEKIGYAALATGDKAAKAVFVFAKKNNMPVSTAQLFLDIQFKPVAVKAMLLGKKPSVTPALGRAEEQAQSLFDQMFLTFGKGAARSRYAITAVNSLMKRSKYTYDEIMVCLKAIPSCEISQALLMGCGERSDCIKDVFSGWLIDYKRSNDKPAA